MKREISVVILVMAMVMGGIIGWAVGNDDMAAYHMTIAQQQQQIESLEKQLAKATQDIYYPNNDDFECEIIRDIIDNIQSANVTYHYDERGYSYGIISLYFELNH